MRLARVACVCLCGQLVSLPTAVLCADDHPPAGVHPEHGERDSCAAMRTNLGLNSLGATVL